MKQDHFGIAQVTLLEPTGLSASDLDAVMHKLTGVGGCDFADMYFQYAKQESWSLDEGVVKTGSFTIDQGVGLRSVCGEKTAFAYSEDLHVPAILAAADVVQAIGRQGGGAQAPRQWQTRSPRALYPLSLIHI